MSNMKTILSVLVAMLMLSGIAMANDSLGVSLFAPTNPSNFAPVITVVGDNPATVERYTTYTDAGATATDTEDGNLTGAIVTTGTVDNTTVGTYTITYTVTDSLGTTDTKTRMVNVVDTTAPADVDGLSVGTVTSTSIQITWLNTNASLSPDFTDVLVSVVKHSDGTPVLTKQSVGKVETYTITGLEAGTEYDITVYTRDDQP